MARELAQRGLGNMEVPLVSPHEERPGPRISPEAMAGPWNTLTFGWLSNIIAEGYRREVLRQRGPQQGGREPLVPEGQRDEPPQAFTEEDLLELRPDDRPEVLGERMQAKWDEQERRPPDSRSLRNALFKAFGATFAVGGAFKFVYDTLQMVGPYVLKRFLAYLNDCKVEECSTEVGLGWVAVIFVSSLAQTVVLHQYFHRCFRTGMRFNAAAISLIYKKSLCIAGPGKLADDKKKAPGAANGQRPQSPQQGEQPAQGAQQPQQQRTSGEIVNLMAVDSQRLQDTMAYLHTLWSGPYQITITLIFLFSVVHWATLAGLAIMMLQVPLVAFVSRRVKLAQRELMKVKDERVKVTNETFGSIRLLKMYGWEDSFEQRLTAIRDRELRYLRRYQLLNIISSAMWSVAPILTGVATFGVYTAFYGDLSAATAFSALSLFNVLRFPLTMFPNMVTSAVEANVALKRIEDFLGSAEIRGRPPPPPTEYAQTAGARLAVRLQKAKFEWPGGIPLLSDVTFSVPAPVPNQARAHMTVIIGAVGVGKSGLLQALIGDLGPVSGEGSVAVSGTIAYAAQVAWIRNATIKDNILFNSPYDEQRYLAVVKACQLIPDLQQLDHGEMTEIGEKGVNLSGGQKQRVALARAVYAGADLLLLDDPLSAVDSEVAKKLLAMLTGELVRNSSIVLCTHHLGALRYADQVILLERSGGGDGRGASSPSRPSTESRVAFCGKPEDFKVEYPQMWAHGDEAFTRQASGEDMASIQAKVKGVGKADGGRLVQREVEQQGAVGWNVYKTYIDYAGGKPMAVAVCIGLLFGQACQTGADTWVSFWSDHSKEDSDPHVSSGFGLLGYVITSFAAFFGIIGTSFLFRTTALRAAKAFHQQLLHNMLKLPQRFYDTTPQGRVLNRFSKDVYTVDEQLVSILMMYFQTMCRVLATIVVISFATPWFLVIIVPLLLVYRHTQNYYVPSSRQLKRIESNLRSPIFSHFGETLDGVASIRAFGQQREFITESTAKIQKSMRAYYLNVASNRWLAVRLETLGTFIVAAASLLAVLARDTISAGVAGLSISYALSVTQALNWVVRMTSDRETNIVSVERLAEYIRETTEPPRWDPLDPRPGEWPRQGKVDFFGVRMRYRQGLPLVLDGLDLEVAAKEKLGICGRTGAGKSSLLNVLLRIVDPEEGRVVIDGLNTLTLGLHTLRRSITVLPQDPVLFSGTLRFNLDPLSECTDDKIWQALQRSNLAGHAQALASQTANHPAPAAGEAATANGAEPSVSDCLNAVVAEKGENFSLGQRQQLCLARALLRSNKILLLDEATSAVDVETDAQIQETIRKEFAEHTVFCIAHRISTIMSYDRICVVEGGKVAELGPPQELRNKPDSRFRALAENDSSR